MYSPNHSGSDLLKEAISIRLSEGAGATAEELAKIVSTSSHRQVFVSKADNGEPLGYLAAAKISKYTLRILVDDPSYQLRSYELREGRILFIVDAYFRASRFKAALPRLMGLLKRYRLICFVKNGKLKVYHNGSSGLKSVVSKIACASN